MIKEGIIGENIRKYRKHKNMTQSDLAKELGVTVQAVSKWECGGLPDASLLFDIANILGVSIDSLYGINDETKADHLSALKNELINTEESERMLKLERMVLALIVASSGNTTLSDLFDNFEGIEEGEKFSLLTMVIEKGFALSNQRKDHPYIFFDYDIDNCYDAQVASAEDYRSFFKLLSKEYVVDIIIYILHLPSDSGVTTSAVAAKLKIDINDVQNIMTELKEANIVLNKPIQTEEGKSEIWYTISQNRILAFLIMAREMIEKYEYYTNLNMLGDDYKYLLK